MRRKPMLAKVFVGGLLLAGALGAAGAAAAGSEGLAITSPSAGGYLSGSDATIAWTYSGFDVAEPLVIEAAPNDTNFQIVAVTAIGAGGATPGTGSFPWDTTRWPDSGDYSIRLRLLRSSLGATVRGVTVDNTAPEISFVQGPAPTAAGWNKEPVAVAWSCSDRLAGVPGQPVTRVDNFTASGEYEPSFECEDRAGNVASDVTLVRIDVTPPVVGAPTRSPEPNAAGWNTTDVTVTWTCTDAQSGAKADSVSASVTGEGANLTAGATCEDLAGNSVAASLSGIKIDRTAPSAAVAAPSRVADQNGWYNHPFTLGWTATDALSGVAACTADEEYAGPDGSFTRSGTCSDAAGNEGAAGSFAFDYDATDPVIGAPQRAPAPNAFGWNNTDVTVTWSCADVTSGAPAQTSATVAGQGQGLTATGTCTDEAGNSASDTHGPVNIDRTAPTVTVSADRASNGAGWYREPIVTTVAGQDSLSGVLHCSAPGVYAGPDDATASVEGTCTDKAGNTGTGSIAFGYDATPPTIARFSRLPAKNAKGWNNSPVTVTWSCDDATSGAAFPTVSETVSTQGRGQSVKGSCGDLAGNVSSDTEKHISIDTGAPTVTGKPDTEPNAAGWHRAAVTVTWKGEDSLSGIDDCSAPETYASPDTSGVTLDGSCTDRAGNVGDGTFTVKLDTLAPGATAGADRAPNGAGWYNAPVTVTWTGDAGTGSPVAACTAAQTYEGPDSDSKTLSGSCTDAAGNESAPATVTLKYDETAPVIVVADRQPVPNQFGWNNTDVTVSWRCEDLTSGVPVPPASTTVGGEGENLAASRSCADAAGNSATATHGPINIDRTAPTVTGAADRPDDRAGWYNRPFTITWTGTDTAGGSGVRSCTLPGVYRGPDIDPGSAGGTCTDRAGNTGTGTFAFKYDATAPVMGEGTPSPAPNAAGWNNTDVSVAWTCADATSGAVASPVTGSTSGEGRLLLVDGTCSDVAGNTTSKKAGPYMVDKTAPSATVKADRAPDHGDWYTASFTATWSGADETGGSAMVACTAPATYAGPDTATGSLPGGCSDAAGNATSAPFAFKYDATAPVVGAPVKAPNAEWANVDVTVTWSCTDATSGAVQAQTIATVTEEGDDNTATATCEDNAGNTSTGTLTPVKIDKTDPEVTGTPDIEANANGWHKSAFTVAWSADDDGLSPVACSANSPYSGPDALAGELTGSCTDQAGNTGQGSFEFNYDATAPVVGAATIAPEPNAAGWNNTDVTVTWACSDATSGTTDASATLATEGANQTATAQCEDAAGNTANASQGGIDIDKTAPTASGAPSRAPDSGTWYSAALTVTWSGSDALSGPAGCTAPTPYSGPDGEDVSVSGSCTDVAGNSTPATFTFDYDATGPTGQILGPPVTVCGTGRDLAGTAADPTSAVNDVRVLFTPAGGAEKAATVRKTLDEKNAAWTVDTVGLVSGGTYTVTVTIRDKAGNSTQVLSNLICA